MWGNIPMFDILFRNAKVIDGTGNPWFYGDVGVEGGTVAAVLPPGSTARARRVEDVDGDGINELLLTDLGGEKPYMLCDVDVTGQLVTQLYSIWE